MQKIKGLVYMLFFIITSMLVVLFFLLFKNKMHSIRRTWAKLQRRFLGYKIIQKGTFDKNANMILINHQSLLDIVAIEEMYPRDLCWVAKKEIKNIPVVGKCITLPKMIYVDRSNPRELVRIIREANLRIKEGRVIAIFPEGTRGRGEKLLKFQNGAKAIAEKLSLKVQPIVVLNTKNIFDSKTMNAKRGNIIIICLDSVDTVNPNWFKNARENMQKVLDCELNFHKNNCKSVKSMQ